MARMTRNARNARENIYNTILSQEKITEELLVAQLVKKFKGDCNKAYQIVTAETSLVCELEVKAAMEVLMSC